MLYIYGLLTPPTARPAAPLESHGRRHQASAITLNWVNNANNQSGFLIERSTGNASNFTQIAVASVGALSYTDTTASPFTTYYYRIRATNAIDAAYSDTARTATTFAATAPMSDLYHFDEGSGTTTADSAGTNNGTLVGSPLPKWVTPGKVGTGGPLLQRRRCLRPNGQRILSGTVANDLSPILEMLHEHVGRVGQNDAGRQQHAL